MLFDFIVEELANREPEDVRRIRPLRVALQNQRDDLLAFAGVLDAKLADIAQAHVIPGSMQSCGVCSGFGRLSAHGARVSWWQSRYGGSSWWRSLMPGR